jgi:hypothetical protein
MRRSIRMIKVLNRGIEHQVYRQECEKCNAELEFSADDTYEGAFGMRYIQCPICGYELMTELDSVDLTSDNIKFPAHFYHMGNSEDSVDIPDEEIQKWVRKGLKAFEDGEAEDFWFSGTGNVFVIILAMEDEYSIYVMKNYWECDIPKVTTIQND